MPTARINQQTWWPMPRPKRERLPPMRGKTVQEIKAESLTSSEMVSRTEVTRRQLQWWEETGFLKPAYGQIGHQRRYSLAQETVVRKIIMLRKAGIALHRSKALLDLKWDTVQAVSAPMVIGGLLLLPSKYMHQPVCNIKRRHRATDGDRLDRIALADPSIAAGRQAGL
jgi:DNA-binding transcriptional MerR regulator